ncbi:MAG: lactonase family protein [Gemmatimonadota bacterium]|nr:lactonase family protein [Gemmatimonadota bacterium]
MKAVLGLTLLAMTLVGCEDDVTGPDDDAVGAVYVMTNEAAGNSVIAYRRAEDGRLSPLGTFPTGGRGTGRTRLSSQDPVTLSPDNRLLFVANVGSNDVSVFSVRDDGLERVALVSSGGEAPNSLTISGNVLYVLNNGGAGNITGFRVASSGQLTPLAGSTRPLSGNATDPAQVRFSPDGRTLLVTEKKTDNIGRYAVDANGVATGPVITSVADADGTPVTPFGGDFTRSGVFVVTEAAGADPGQAAVSSFSLTGTSGVRFISNSVGDTRTEVCWTVITPDDRYAYVTNFADGTISSYAIAADGTVRLLNPVAGTTSLGQLSIRDNGITEDGRYMYAIDIFSRMVHGWRVQSDGSLMGLGAAPGLPGTVAGIAVR